MSDVARRAGVSPSTVSLHLRRPGAVSPSAGQAIARAIADLGYVPNLMAGGLAGAASRVVSIVVPSVRNAFFAETVATLQEALGREGYQVMLGHTEYSGREEEALVRAALSWNAAAIVLTGQSHDPATRRLIETSRVPVVEVWELGAAPLDMAVGFDHARVGETAAQHLIGQGRRRLAFAGARLHLDRRADRRAQGFIKAAEIAGIAATLIGHPGPAGVEAGGVLLARVLHEMPDIDGLAFSNDHLALGALFECQRRGVSVPDRLAVIGFGDLDFARACNPALTTIRPEGRLIGEEAARLILEAIRTGRRGSVTVVDVGHVLVRRLSA